MLTDKDPLPRTTPFEEDGVAYKKPIRSLHLVLDRPEVKTTFRATKGATTLVKELTLEGFGTLAGDLIAQTGLAHSSESKLFIQIRTKPPKEVIDEEFAELGIDQEECDQINKRDGEICYLPYDPEIGDGGYYYASLLLDEATFDGLVTDIKASPKRLGASFQTTNLYVAETDFYAPPANTVTWFLREDQGRAKPAGIYFKALDSITLSDLPDQTSAGTETDEKNDPDSQHAAIEPERNQVAQNLLSLAAQAEGIKGLLMLNFMALCGIAAAILFS